VRRRSPRTPGPPNSAGIFRLISPNRPDDGGLEIQARTRADPVISAQARIRNLVQAFWVPAFASMRRLTARRSGSAASLPALSEIGNSEKYLDYFRNIGYDHKTVGNPSLSCPALRTRLRRPKASPLRRTGLGRKIHDKLLKLLNWWKKNEALKPRFSTVQPAFWP
jgi:hypothetical protein